MKLYILNHFCIPLVLLAFLPGINVQLNAQGNPKEGPIHYVFPTFTKGTVIVKSGKKNEFQINYNKITEEMVIEYNENKISLNKLQSVDTAIIQNRIFIPVGEVFHEIALEASMPLYVQHKVKASEEGKSSGYGSTSQTGAISSSTDMIRPSDFYALKLSDNYRITEATIFWVKKDGSMFDFRTKKQFLKIFPDYDNELKSFIKKNKIDMKNRADLIKLVGYCNEMMF